MASGEMDRPEFTAFLGQALRNLAAFSVEAGLFVTACPEIVSKHKGLRIFSQPRQFAISSALRVGG